MSEFGKGFIYPLILWAKHLENSMTQNPMKEEVPNFSLWINGASDHLYGFQFPDNLPEELKIKCEGLKEMALDWGHGNNMMKPLSEKDFEYLVDLTKEIAMEIDKWLNVEVEKGQWE